MKFKGLTKLALSGVALAAVAATLGTSTYAWYVSNSVATVGGLNATTAGSETGNVMVCQLTEDTTSKILSRAGNWGNKLESVSLKKLVALSPVTKDTTGEGGIAPTSNPTGWHDKENAPVTEANAYGYYAFGLWSTDKTSIDIQFGAKNTTSTFKYQTCYANSGVGNTAVNATFTIDAMNALRVEVFQTEFADDADANSTTIAKVFDTATAANNSTNLGTYCPADTFYNDGLATDYASPTGVEHMLAKGDSVNANTYYNTIMNENPAGGATEAGASTLASATKNITIGKNGSGTDATTKKYIIAFRYWLEGTDKECFDSCINQSFAFNLAFTVHQEAQQQNP